MRGPRAFVSISFKCRPERACERASEERAGGWERERECVWIFAGGVSWRGAAGPTMFATEDQWLQALWALCIFIWRGLILHVLGHTECAPWQRKLITHNESHPKKTIRNSTALFSDFSSGYGHANLSIIICFSFARLFKIAVRAPVPCFFYYYIASMPDWVLRLFPPRKSAAPHFLPTHFSWNKTSPAINLVLHLIRSTTQKSA